MNQQLTPLENILDCMETILKCRMNAVEDPRDALFCMIGIIDHQAEAQRQLEELGVVW